MSRAIPDAAVDAAVDVLSHPERRVLSWPEMIRLTLEKAFGVALDELGDVPYAHPCPCPRCRLAFQSGVDAAVKALRGR